MSYLLGQMDATRIIGESISKTAEKMQEKCDDVAMGSGIRSEGHPYDVARFMLEHLGKSLVIAAELMEAKIRAEACADGIAPDQPRGGPRAD